MFGFWGDSGNAAFALPVDASSPLNPSIFSGVLAWDPAILGFYYSSAMSLDRITSDIGFAGNVGVAINKVYKVNNLQVVGARATGWGVPTGTPVRTTFNTATATTADVAQRLAALINDLTTHGLIGA